ncbi:MAG: hypothetical protein LBV06_00355 [Propionibacteriaceae bacterium]|nr:hypothetical protein [Propionibacteriaceae bacterium]
MGERRPAFSHKPMCSLLYDPAVGSRRSAIVLSAVRRTANDLGSRE